MASTRIWRIGLTGGIGSGKSTVAGMLAELGAAMLKGQPEVIDQFRQSLNRSAAILAA